MRKRSKRLFQLELTDFTNKNFQSNLQNREQIKIHRRNVKAEQAMRLMKETICLIIKVREGEKTTLLHLRRFMYSALEQLEKEGVCYLDGYEIRQGKRPASRYLYS